MKSRKVVTMVVAKGEGKMIKITEKEGGEKKKGGGMRMGGRDGEAGFIQEAEVSTRHVPDNTQKSERDELIAFPQQSAPAATMKSSDIARGIDPLINETMLPTMVK